MPQSAGLLLVLLVKIILPSIDDLQPASILKLLYHPLGMIGDGSIDRKGLLPNLGLYHRMALLIVEGGDQIAQGPYFIRLHELELGLQLLECLIDDLPGSLDKLLFLDGVYPHGDRGWGMRGDPFQTCLWDLQFPCRLCEITIIRDEAGDELRLHLRRVFHIVLRHRASLLGSDLLSAAGSYPSRVRDVHPFFVVF